MEVGKENLKGYIDSILLSIISNEPMYGYQVSKMINKYTNRSFVMKEATLYSSLRRLEKKDFITSYWEDSIGNSRRKYYVITKEGDEYLKLKKEEWHYFRGVIDIFLNGSEDL
ncbi:PadR family transcriptional regulator [Bacillus sp. CRN 9]|nr:PadR family transcriptional regulator [Bacillus sp. CRN 9]